MTQVTLPPSSDAFRTEPTLGLPAAGRVDRQPGVAVGSH
jgi:hypothetical protein